MREFFTPQGGSSYVAGAAHFFVSQAVSRDIRPAAGKPIETLRSLH